MNGLGDWLNTYFERAAGESAYYRYEKKFWPYLLALGVNAITGMILLVPRWYFTFVGKALILNNLVGSDTLNEATLGRLIVEAIYPVYAFNLD
jgi:hypothetical protein